MSVTPLLFIFWSSPYVRASMQVTTATETLSTTWAKKLELKAKRKAIMAMEQEMKDQKRQEVEVCARCHHYRHMLLLLLLLLLGFFFPLTLFCGCSFMYHHCWYCHYYCCVCCIPSAIFLRMLFVGLADLSRFLSSELERVSYPTISRFCVMFAEHAVLSWFQLE